MQIICQFRQIGGMFCADVGGDKETERNMDKEIVRVVSIYRNRSSICLLIKLKPNQIWQGQARVQSFIIIARFIVLSYLIGLYYYYSKQIDKPISILFCVTVSRKNAK